VENVESALAGKVVLVLRLKPVPPVWKTAQS